MPQVCTCVCLNCLALEHCGNSFSGCFEEAYYDVVRFEDDYPGYELGEDPEEWKKDEYWEDHYDGD